MAQVAQPTIAPISGPDSTSLLREKDTGSIRTEPKESSQPSADRMEPQESAFRKASVITSGPGDEPSLNVLENFTSPLNTTQDLRRPMGTISPSFDSTEAVSVKEDGSLRALSPSAPASPLERAEASASVRRQPETSKEKIHAAPATEFHGEEQITRSQREPSQEVPFTGRVNNDPSPPKSLELGPRSVIPPETSSHPQTMNAMTTGRPLRSDLRETVSERPIIRVTIGRIDVRAIPPPPPTLRQPSPPAPGLSLDDYLKERNGGQR